MQSAECALHSAGGWSSDMNGERPRVYMLVLCSSFYLHSLWVTFAPHHLLRRSTLLSSVLTATVMHTLRMRYGFVRCTHYGCVHYGRAALYGRNAYVTAVTRVLRSSTTIEHLQC